MNEVAYQPKPGILRSLSAAAAAVGAELDARGVPKHLGLQQRKVTLSGYDKDAHTVTMAVSSSTPVQRYFGTEILSHDKGALNTERLDNGVAMLFNHNMDAHIGRSVSYELGDPLRVTCRFGTNPLALEKEADIASGILVDVSISYTVEEWDITENAKTGERTYTATQWTLLEVSPVTVPADPSVGVGRSSDPKPNIRSFRTIDENGNDVVDDTDTTDMAEAERTAQAEAQRTADAAAAESSAPTIPTTPAEQRTPIMEPTAVVDLAAQEAERKTALRALHTQYPQEFNARALAAAEGLNVPVAEIQRSIANSIIEGSRREDVPTIGDEVLGSMSARELAQYSLRDAYAAAINARSPGTFTDKGATGLVLDVSQSLRKLASERGIDGIGNGVLIPSLSSRASAAAKRTIASGGNAGTATNFTVVEQDPIELLRSRVAVFALGARYLSGLKGKIQMPKQTGAASSNWVTEGTNATNSDLTLGDFIMSPNHLNMQNSYYRDFFAQSALAIDPLLAEDRYQVLQRALDTAAISGSGTAPVPLGLLNQSGLAAVLAGTTRAANGTVTTGLGGVPPTYVDWNNMEAVISTANGDIGTMRWLTTPKIRAAARSIPQVPGAATAKMVWPDGSTVGAGGIQAGPLGYGALCTAASYLTGFTANSIANLHAIILGVWDQLLIGDWGLSEVIVDNVTGAAAAKVIITEHAFYDINVRHIESFAACTSALPS